MFIFCVSTLKAFSKSQLDKLFLSAQKCENEVSKVIRSQMQLCQTINQASVCVCFTEPQIFVTFRSDKKEKE